SIGREHVVSMVNTLVLAYAGSALALFLFIILNPLKLPIWVMINSEDISDEIIRTFAGSMGLVLVIPIVTLLAVFVCNSEVKRAAKQIFHSLK
ncbi:MAG TPA: YibE/F family protein, partial [Candidatus Saccharimonadales bacterium]|nr:YibE/F family protein [Candidatus Saccharimonadales bacterium]